MNLKAISTVCTVGGFLFSIVGGACDSTMMRNEIKKDLLKEMTPKIEQQVKHEVSHRMIEESMKRRRGH